MERKTATWKIYPLRTDNGDVDRTTTRQWLRSCSLKGETEGFTLAVQDQSLATRMYLIERVPKTFKI